MQMCASAVHIFFEYVRHGMITRLNCAVKCQISQKTKLTNDDNNLRKFSIIMTCVENSCFRTFKLQTGKLKKKTRPLINQVGPQKWSGPPRSVRATQKIIFFNVLLHELYQKTVFLQFFTARTESRLTYSRNNLAVKMFILRKQKKAIS